MRTSEIREGEAYKVGKAQTKYVVLAVGLERQAGGRTLHDGVRLEVVLPEDQAGRQEEVKARDVTGKWTRADDDRLRDRVAADAAWEALHERLRLLGVTAHRDHLHRAALTLEHLGVLVDLAERNREASWTS